MSDDGYTRLEMSVRRGMPLSMAGYLLRAVGAAYPGTKLDTESGDLAGPTLSLLIPDADLFEPSDVSAAALEEMAEKDAEEVTVFTQGFKRDGSMGLRPPKWLSDLLLMTAGQMVDAMPHSAENYMAITINPTGGGEPFEWIVSRPGKPSPHELRMAAEARADRAEAELADLRAAVVELKRA